VIKVFESFDLSRVGQLQSLLEAHGIRTYMKNQYSAGVMGELPFVEVYPQLFILEDGDLSRVQALLREDSPADHECDWSCADCGTEVEGAFTQCWQCGAGRPER
jgi:hypothetical protein